MHITKINSQINLDWVLAKINKAIREETEIKGFGTVFTKEDLKKIIESGSIEIALTKDTEKTILVLSLNDFAVSEDMISELKTRNRRLFFYFKHVEPSVTAKVMATAFDDLPIRSKQWIQIAFQMNVQEKLAVKRKFLFKDVSDYSYNEFGSILIDFADRIHDIFSELQEKKELKPYLEISEGTHTLDLGLPEITKNSLIGAKLHRLGDILEKINEKPDFQALYKISKFGKMGHDDLVKVLDFYNIQY